MYNYKSALKKKRMEPYKKAKNKGLQVGGADTGIPP